MPSKSMPSKLLDRLNLDHRRLSQVLDVIDAAAKQIETAAHGEALDHLEAALRYVAEYPDEVHHPLEERVYALLLECDLATQEREVVAEVQGQHESLLDQTKTLLAELPRLSVDGAMRQRVAEQLQVYSQAQRNHMSFEQHQVFPLIEASLPASTLRQLDAEHVPVDPLFDTRSGRFEAIFDYVVASGDYQGGAAPVVGVGLRSASAADGYRGARQLASGTSHLLEMAERLGGIQMQQWRLALEDDARTFQALLGGQMNPVQLWSDHLARRLEHINEGWQQATEVWQSQWSRAARASERLWVDPPASD